MLTTSEDEERFHRMLLPFASSRLSTAGGQWPYPLMNVRVLKVNNTLLVSDDALRYDHVARQSNAAGFFFVLDRVHHLPLPNVFDRVTRPLVQRQNQVFVNRPQLLAAIAKKKERMHSLITV